MKQLSSRNS